MPRKNNKISKLVLGTVQLGMKYGINNKTGKPNKKQALKILNTAFKHGIKILDTAPSYGESEKILGEFIKKNKLADKIRVISKIKSFGTIENPTKALQFAEKEIKETIKNLKIKKLDGYLFHDPKDFYNKNALLALKYLKEKNLTQNIGVSIYKPKDALYAAKYGNIDYIQIPYNVFDQRLNKTNFFKLAQTNGIKVFARSPFLQGLILMDEKEIPPHLSEIKKYSAKFEKIIKKYKLTKQEAALLFVFNNKNIDHPVFGAETVSQLIQNLKIIKKTANFSKCFSELENNFAGVKKIIISPNLWF